VILDFIDDDGAMMPVRHVSFDIRKPGILLHTHCISHLARLLAVRFRYNRIQNYMGET
jgi:hypothetical protein